MSAITGQLRPLVPYFTHDASINERLALHTPVSAPAPHAPIRTVEVREWDHAEGYFTLKSHTVADTHTPAPSPAPAAPSPMASPSPPANGKKVKKARAAKKAGSPAPVVADAAERTPDKKKALCFAGTSFETASPEPSKIPLPSFLRVSQA